MAGHPTSVPLSRIRKPRSKCHPALPGFLRTSGVFLKQQQQEGTPGGPGTAVPLHRAVDRGHRFCPKWGSRSTHFLQFLRACSGARRLEPPLFEDSVHGQRLEQESYFDGVPECHGQTPDVGDARDVWEAVTLSQPVCRPLDKNPRLVCVLRGRPTENLLGITTSGEALRPCVSACRLLHATARCWVSLPQFQTAHHLAVLQAISAGLFRENCPSGEPGPSISEGSLPPPLAAAAFCGLRHYVRTSQSVAIPCLPQGLPLKNGHHCAKQKAR